MQYNIGDRVKIKENLVIDDFYDDVFFDWHMGRHRGETFTVLEITKYDTYILEGTGIWEWNDDMIDYDVNLFLYDELKEAQMPKRDIARKLKGEKVRFIFVEEYDYNVVGFEFEGKIYIFDSNIE